MVSWVVLPTLAAAAVAAVVGSVVSVTITSHFFSGDTLV